MNIVQSVIQMVGKSIPKAKRIPKTDPDAPMMLKALRKLSFTLTISMLICESEGLRELLFMRYCWSSLLASRDLTELNRDFRFSSVGASRN
jgi:hypothetical protein